MSSGKPTHYRLSPRALEDLDEIWRYTAETWSVDQADRYTDALAHTFDTIVAMPTMARERTEFDPPVRIHSHGRHLIAYILADDHIVILRLLGGRQDWQRFLDAIDS